MSKSRRVNATWVDRTMTHTPSPAGDLGHGQFGESGTWRTGGSRATDTLGARAITLCSCSTSSVTARGPCCVRGTYIAHTGGVMYWIRILSRTGRQECRYLRPIAAFTKPAFYECLKQRHVLYAIRLPGTRGAAIGRSPLCSGGRWAGRRSVRDPIRRLLVSCRDLGPRSAGGSQGGVA